MEEEVITGRQLHKTMKHRSENGAYPDVNGPDFETWCTQNGLEAESLLKFIDDTFPSCVRMLMRVQLENPQEAGNGVLRRVLQAIILGTFILAWDVAHNGPVE